ncbi:CsbD family protein [Pseudomonas sp. BN414]|uniref:CsbD family protein n=1 Tax=Pseudomonas sp. BN414 TaxID=2567888 RepID=UPI00245606BA|nr:CsbD family protein [Pseudomonas sp. BN414]
MNKDQFKSKVDQLKGQIKEATGKLFGNQRLENESAGSTAIRGGSERHDPAWRGLFACGSFALSQPGPDDYQRDR